MVCLMAKKMIGCLVLMMDQGLVLQMVAWLDNLTGVLRIVSMAL